MPASRRSRRARGATRRASSGLRSSLVALLSRHRDLNLARSFISRVQQAPVPSPGKESEGPSLFGVHHNFPRKDASENYAVAFHIQDGLYDDSMHQPMMIITAHKDGSRFVSADIEIGNRLVPENYMGAYPEDLGHVAAIGPELSKVTGQLFGLRF